MKNPSLKAITNFNHLVECLNQLKDAPMSKEDHKELERLCCSYYTSRVDRFSDKELLKLYDYPLLRTYGDMLMASFELTIQDGVEVDIPIFSSYLQKKIPNNQGKVKIPSNIKQLIEEADEKGCFKIDDFHVDNVPQYLWDMCVKTRMAKAIQNNSLLPDETLTKFMKSHEKSKQLEDYVLIALEHGNHKQVLNICKKEGDILLKIMQDSTLTDRARINLENLHVDHCPQFVLPNMAHFSQEAVTRVIKEQPQEAIYFLKSQSWQQDGMKVHVSNHTPLPVVQALSKVASEDYLRKKSEEKLALYMEVLGDEFYKHVRHEAQVAKWFNMPVEIPQPSLSLKPMLKVNGLQHMLTKLRTNALMDSNVKFVEIVRDHFHTLTAPVKESIGAAEFEQDFFHAAVTKSAFSHCLPHLAASMDLMQERQHVVFASFVFDCCLNKELHSQDWIKQSLANVPQEYHELYGKSMHCVHGSLLQTHSVKENFKHTHHLMLNSFIPCQTLQNKRHKV